MGKLAIDIQNENFDLYFTKNACLLSDTQKASIPNKIFFRLFKRGGGFSEKSINKLSFLEKTLILIKCCKKKFFWGFEDEHGLDEQEFFKLKETINADTALESSEVFVNSGHFFLVGNQLMDGFNKLNSVSVSSLSNYLMRGKNIPDSNIMEWKKQSNYLASFIINYESIKKKSLTRHGLVIPEFYTLLYLYDGAEKVSSGVYLKAFGNVTNATRSQIQASFTSLKAKGFVVKKGLKKGATLKITILGKDCIDDILKSDISNF